MIVVRAPVDDFRPAQDSFASFFYARSDLDEQFLVELHREHGTRQRWTVGQWQERVTVVAEWLTSQGAATGSSVATLAGNTADALAVAYGCWVLGACAVPLNPADSLERMTYILEDTATSLLVYAATTADRAGDLLRATGVPIATVSSLPKAAEGPGSSRGSQRQPDVVAAASGIDIPALRVYTSGTTGDPKGVVLTVTNLLTDCDALAQGFNWPIDTRIFTVLPIHHVNGLVVSSLLPWYARLSTVLCDRFRSETFWADVESEGATVCSVVPSLLEFLLATGGATPDCFREFACGAGPLLVETAVDCEQRFQVPIRHLWGLSETTAVATLMPQLNSDERARWHREYGFPSIGPALPHVEVAVLDQQGVELLAGLRGELAVRGGIVMQEYASKPLETADAFSNGWFHTGDEGFWQPGPGGRSFFFITGRIKELIIRGGANVSPFEVDSVLRSHPAVKFGLTVPFENRFYGEEIAAYVVRDGDVSEEDILAHCARFLDYARCPKVVIFGDEVPYTTTGKAKRLELKTRLAPVLTNYRDVQFRRSRMT